LVVLDTSSSALAIIAPTSATGVVGIAKTSVFQASSVDISTRGVTTCVSDNATTVNHLVGVSTSVAGDCTDLATVDPSAVPGAKQIIGRWLVTGAAGTVSLELFGPENYGGAFLPLTGGTLTGNLSVGTTCPGGAPAGSVCAGGKVYAGGTELGSAEYVPTGMDATGVVDATSILTAALSAHQNVKMPPGTFKLTAKITLATGQTLTGMGNSLWAGSPTAFVAAFTGPAFEIPEGAGSVTLKHFSVSCASTASSVGLLIGGTVTSNWATRITVDDVGFSYCGDNVLVESAWGLSFNHLISVNALRYGVYLHPPTGGFTTTILIGGHSEIASNGSSGLFADGQNQNIAIENSVIQTNGAIDVHFTGTASALSIKNTYFEGTLPALVIAANYSPSILLESNSISNIMGVDLGGNSVTSYSNTGIGIPNSPALTAALSDASTVGVLGSDLITNGGFSSGSNWTLLPSSGSGWSVSGGVANAAGVSWGQIYQNISAVTGSLYKVTYTATVTTGAVQVALGGAVGPAHSISGTYTDYITDALNGGFADGVLYITQLNGFVGTVDNISAKLITPSPIYTSPAAGSQATIAVTGSGCGTTVNSAVGDAMGGAFVVATGSGSYCYFTITMGGLTAPNLWNCTGAEEGTDHVINQVSPYSTTTGKLAATVSAGDPITWACTAH
jgi:hypothetical protein